MNASVTSTKANVGGIAGVLAPAISAGLIKAVEAWWMIDVPVEYELMIVSAVTGLVTRVVVWFFPNKPKEA